jgi:hypothetical protein
MEEIEERNGDRARPKTAWETGYAPLPDWLKVK